MCLCCARALHRTATCTSCFSCGWYNVCPSPALVFQWDLHAQCTNWNRNARQIIQAPIDPYMHDRISNSRHRRLLVIGYPDGTVYCPTGLRWSITCPFGNVGSRNPLVSCMETKTALTVTTDMMAPVVLSTTGRRAKAGARVNCQEFACWDDYRFLLPSSPTPFLPSLTTPTTTPQPPPTPRPTDRRH